MANQLVAKGAEQTGGTGSSVHERQFTFEPSPAVQTSRASGTFVPCPACGSEESQHLFHQRGVRFVRCAACSAVYASPVGASRTNYFDIEQQGQHDQVEDRTILLRDFDELVGRLSARFRAKHGRNPRGAMVVGRTLPEFEEGTNAAEVGLKVVRLDDAGFDHMRQSGEAKTVLAAAKTAELVILHEFLEASVRASRFVEDLRAAVSASTWVAVVYANLNSMPARVLRRHWPHFFDHKSVYFNRENLVHLFYRSGFALATQLRRPEHLSLGYAAERLGSHLPQAARNVPLLIPTGAHVAVFTPRDQTRTDRGDEKLSILFPCFNEERTVRDVLEALLAKQVKIAKEIIVVESNSTDNTRAIVREFEGRPGIKIVYEDKPQGKGHAVKTALAHATGSIILIQDADFEYDLDDYDALLEPILQRKTSFVLGSRSLGMDDWKVRKYAETPVKGFLMNFAQVVFAQTFNALYQQNTTDVNTMFKIFRTECLDGVTLESDGFNLDIELVCKIVKGGYSPMEVPVNYVSRGFEEGKKISFFTDAFPSYWAFFKFRFDE